MSRSETPASEKVTRTDTETLARERSGKICGRICDLHTHSNFSDGTCIPEELVRLAEEKNLCAVALTDHNTAHGLARFMAAGRKSSVQTIPGAELSTTYDGHEVHMLALFLPESSFEQVDMWAEELWKNKRKSNLALTKALSQAGYPVDLEEIEARTPGGQVNRALIGAELERKGCMTISEAFGSVLRPRKAGGLYDPPDRPPTLRTIEQICEMGALPVLAHGFLNFTMEGLEAFLPEAKAHGLAGMETHYVTYDEAKTRASQALAAKFDLLESGGSDFHGTRKPGIEIGTGYGNLAVPCELKEKLDMAARSSRAGH